MFTVSVLAVLVHDFLLYMTASTSSPPPTRLCIAGSFYVEPCEDSLRWAAAILGTPIEVAFAGFGQVLQSLLNPAEAQKSYLSGHG